MRYRAELVCGCLLAMMATTLVTVVDRKGITIDDSLMIPAGYYHLTARDFRLVNEHPPVAKLLAAIPLLFTGTEAPRIAAKDPDRAYFDELLDGFWRANDARYERLVYWSRVPAIALTLVLGACVFLFARRLFGDRAALIAVALLVLEPTMLAHGRSVQTDVLSALGLLLTSFAVLAYVRGPTVRRAALVGLALGFAVVTKFSMVALVPVAFAAAVGLVVVAPKFGVSRARAGRQVAVCSVIALLTINAAYLFQYREPVTRAFTLTSFGLPDVVRDAVRSPLSWMYVGVQRIVPPDFIDGITWQVLHNQEGHTAGFLGRHGMRGWWGYFPVTFALKTTLPFLVLTVASVMWAVWRTFRRPEARFVVLLLPLGFFAGLLMLCTINIGVRYVIPAYPLLFILAGAFLDTLLRRQNLRVSVAVLMVAALGWMAIEAVRTYPDYMYYVNQMASGAPAWHYLADSNVEWGDDVPELARYLRSRGVRVVRAAVQNVEVLERYGISPVGEFTNQPAPNGTRYIAVGASWLNGAAVPDWLGGVRLTEDQRVNFFDAYRGRKPERVFGRSIYLYATGD